jgi:hypothetical protein
MFMKKILLRLANILLFACVYTLPKTNLNASHVIGAELSYECMGAYTYKITLNMYRDCSPGSTPLDNPVRISVFTGGPSSSYMSFLEIPYQGSIILPSTAADTNWVPTPYLCVEVATYSITTTLSSSPSGYIFAYQRCCRSASILNVLDPTSTGSTIFENVPPSDLCNNSPSFNLYPPVALCVNRPMVFDCSATDIDEDSLVYHICSPYQGASSVDPQPLITSTPPFEPIDFASPYNSSYQIAGAPALTIDPISGIATITPTALGDFVIGIGCDEYRNGILIGSHIRDFRFAVTSCPYGIGIEDYTLLEHKVYPNPSTDLIQIKAEQAIQVMVFDLLGKMVYQSTIENPVQNISVSEWAPGVYTYRVYTANGMSTGKFIKQ